MIEVKVGLADCTNPPDCTELFPAAECLCPILPGPSLADVSGGNMGEPLGPGDCTPPEDDGVWSLYSTAVTNIPQEINNWNTGKKKSATSPLLCIKTPMITFANCFSFACVRAGKIHGNVEVATCFCPFGESVSGEPVAPGTAFETQAGQGSPDICSQIPVGIPFPSSN